MMSVSGGWFFVVASEAITRLRPDRSCCPASAPTSRPRSTSATSRAIGYAVLVMLVVILLYDQLLFRPLLAWSRKFKAEALGADEINVRPWFLIMMQRARLFDLLQSGGSTLNRGVDEPRSPRACRGAGAPRRRARRASPLARARCSTWRCSCWPRAARRSWIVRFIHAEVGARARSAGSSCSAAITAMRVLVLIALASLIWVPIGVWIGLRPRIADRVQPIVQFLAAFPANLFFPVGGRADPAFPAQPGDLAEPADDPRDAVVHPVQRHRRHHWRCRPNCSSRPAISACGGWLWWRRLILPAIFPAYVTGAVTAAGGSWNASIVSEVVQWGDTTLARDRHRRLYRAIHRRGRRRPHRARHRRAVPLRAGFNRLLWRRLYRPRRRAAAARLKADRDGRHMAPIATDGRRRRCCAPPASARPIARPTIPAGWCSTISISRCAKARSSPSSANPARANRPFCAFSPA